MQNISLNDQLYQEARERAEKAGFSSVDAYVADLLAHDFQLADENLDPFFTPERLAAVDESAADAARGNIFTLAQAREALKATSDKWHRDHLAGK